MFQEAQVEDNKTINTVNSFQGAERPETIDRHQLSVLAGEGSGL